MEIVSCVFIYYFANCFLTHTHTQVALELTSVLFLHRK